jgi:hypothetical protein
LAEAGALGKCDICGSQLRYFIRYKYAESGVEPEDFEVIRVVRLTADSDDYLFQLRRLPPGTSEYIVPAFWSRGKTGRWNGGHYPRLLSLDGWKKLFAILEAAIAKAQAA